MFGRKNYEDNQKEEQRRKARAQEREELRKRLRVLELEVRTIRREFGEQKQ
jgi:hypothetical protein